MEYLDNWTTYNEAVVTRLGEIVNFGQAFENYRSSPLFGGNFFN
jgi:hypothetical protein